eukprot:4472693-Amphidinium_carterae.1
MARRSAPRRGPSARRIALENVDTLVDAVLDHILIDSVQLLNTLPRSAQRSTSHIDSAERIPEKHL